MMVPGMVTIFLLQFVGIWNNFLLPFIMLSDESKFPLTVGLYTLLSKGSGQPALYSLAIIGAAISIIPLIVADALPAALLAAGPAERRSERMTDRRPWRFCTSEPPACPW